MNMSRIFCLLWELFEQASGITKLKREMVMPIKTGEVLMVLKPIAPFGLRIVTDSV